MYPMVQSSGSLIWSPAVISFPPPAYGIILIANAWLIQNPAPPVANQNASFCPGLTRSSISMGCLRLGFPRYQSKVWLYLCKTLTSLCMFKYVSSSTWQNQRLFVFMYISYSNAILQHNALLVCSLEQFVFNTWPSGSIFWSSASSESVKMKVWFIASCIHVSKRTFNLVKWFLAVVFTDIKISPSSVLCSSVTFWSVLWFCPTFNCLEDIFTFRSDLMMNFWRPLEPKPNSFVKCVSPSFELAKRIFNKMTIFAKNMLNANPFINVLRCIQRIFKSEGIIMHIA